MTDKQQQPRKPRSSKLETVTIDELRRMAASPTLRGGPGVLGGVKPRLSRADWELLHPDRPYPEEEGRTMGTGTTVGLVGETAFSPTVAGGPTVGLPPTAAPGRTGKQRPIVNLTDALSLASRTLLITMYGRADDGDTASRTCRKGYSQLAAEAGLNRWTVRDLIAEFLQLGVIEIGDRYNPDTREPNTYTVHSFAAIKAKWRVCGITHYLPGRKPVLCDASGRPVSYTRARAV